MASCGFVASALKRTARSTSNASLPVEPVGINASTLLQTFSQCGQADVEDELSQHILAHRFIGHTDTILCMAILQERDDSSKRGTILFTGSSDTRICAWDIAMSVLRGVLVGHSGAVLELCLSARYPVLISASRDNDMLIWDRDNFAPLRRVTGRIGCVMALCCFESALFCGSQDSSIAVLDLPRILDGCKFSSSGTDACPSPDRVPVQQACSLAAAQTKPTDDGPAVVLWDDVTVCTRLQHFGTIQALVSTRQHLFSASDDQEIVVWSLRPFQSVQRLRKHTSSVICLDVDESRLYSGSQDTTVVVWDLESLLPVRTLTRHTGTVLVIDASPATGFFTLGSDMNALLWSKETFACLACICFADIQLCLASQLSGCKFDVFTGGSCAGVYHWLLPVRAQTVPVRPCEATGGAGAQLIDYSDEWLVSTLRAFVSFPTVSQDPSFRAECWKGAKFLKRLLEETGFEVKLCSSKSTSPFELNPVVLARYRPAVADASGVPCLMFVGHYDVVPVGAASAWQHGQPFSLFGEGGYLYGRGATDNKGPVIAFVAAVRELIAEKSLNVAVNLVIEGEEENGSRGFASIIEENYDWLQPTNYILVSNSYWIGDDRPCLTYGMRGVIKMRVTIDGPGENLHSGVYGGIQEPMADLIRLLAGLVGSDGRILVPDFFDDVLPVTPDEADILGPTYETFREGGFFDHGSSGGGGGGNDDLLSDPKYVLKRRWQWPTITIHSVTSSIQGEEASVIPKSVSALISMRTVPRQDHQKLIRVTKAHLRHCFKAIFSPNRLKIKTVSTGDWWLGSPNSHFFALADAAIQKVWGVSPLYVREGGTLGTTSFLERRFNATALHLPIGQASDGAHMVNERLKLINLYNGRSVIREIIVGLGQQTKTK